MKPEEAIQIAAEDGVTLELTSEGALKASGPAESVARWLPILREHKVGLVAVLVAAGNDGKFESSSELEAGIDCQPAPSYTTEDVRQIDGLLDELARLEGWTADELGARLRERRQMAPVNVLTALQALRAARDAAQAGWPDKPLERAQIVLCRLVN
jgi:hypothetical protein